MTARRTKKPGSTLEAEVHRLRAQLKQRRVEAKSERELAERRGELAQELREELDSILLHHKKSEREIAALKSALQDARARAADSRQTAHLAEFQNAQSGDALPHMQALDDLVHRRTESRTITDVDWAKAGAAIAVLHSTEPTIVLPASTVENVREAIKYALETFRVMKSDDNPTTARLRAALALLPPPAKETP